MNTVEYMTNVGENAREASRVVASAETRVKNDALLAMAREIRARCSEILSANQKDLENRIDDNEQIAIKRFINYENNIKPVVDFYKQSNLLKEVNGEASISEISAEISDLMESIKG